MPDPRARDPHSLVYSRRGLIVFTVQVGNFVGTLRSAERKDHAHSACRQRAAAWHRADLEGRGLLRRVRHQPDRQPRSDDAQGRRVRCPRPARARGGLRLAATIRFITRTTRVDSWAISIRPPARSRNSSCRAAPTRCRWSDRHIGRGDPAYCETGDNAKNVLVRFNPETKKLLSWPIPGGGGTVRNMDVWKGPAGEVLWLAESGVGKLARVAIRTAVAP